MKIEFAPPGTDPTRIPSPPSKTDVMDTLKDNWLLVGGIAIFAIVTVFRFNLIPGKPEAIATPEPEAVAAATIEPDWCIYLDSIIINEGETVQVGDQWVQCWNDEIRVGPEVSMSAP
jgi:hypothetical protein